MIETNVNYEVSGNPGGPTMVMVHGFLSSNVQWERNIDELGEHLQLVRVELLGHGDSATPDDRDAYSPAAFAASLEAIRTDVGAEKWWVCGQSLGAAFSLRYVLTHQDRVRGVIVTNTRAAFGTGRSDPDLDYTTIDLREVPFHPIHAKRFPADIKERMVAKADAIPGYVLNHTISHRDTFSVVDDLHELTVPLLLVNGRYERVFQPFVDEVRHALADFEIVHLDGGHSINVEQPHGFNLAVLDFIERHTPG